jgi:type IV secretory pathway VirB3-like protein
MLLKNFTRPSFYLGILITCWGIIMTLTGLVQNFAGLLVVRILLGVFEYVLEASNANK